MERATAGARGASVLLVACPSRLPRRSVQDKDNTAPVFAVFQRHSPEPARAADVGTHSAKRDSCNSYRQQFCIASRLLHPRKAPSPPLNPPEYDWPKADVLLNWVWFPPVCASKPAVFSSGIGEMNKWIVGLMDLWRTLWFQQSIHPLIHQPNHPPLQASSRNAIMLSGGNVNDAE